MLAFYTIISNGEILDAHFLGYNRELNHDRQIYQNVLYDIVDHGMVMHKKQIVFARTALEIKSSVGAVPVQLFCYLRHTGTLSGILAPRVVEYLKPEENWVQRHPFKEDHTEQVEA